MLWQRPVKHHVANFKWSVTVHWAVRYRDWNQQMRTSVWKYIIKVVIPATCFGHTCGHPQGRWPRVAETCSRYCYLYNIFSYTCAHLLVLVTTSCSHFLHFSAHSLYIWIGLWIVCNITQMLEYLHICVVLEYDLMIVCYNFVRWNVYTCIRSTDVNSPFELMNTCCTINLWP
jgi:hypothetical protein